MSVNKCVLVHNAENANIQELQHFDRTPVVGKAAGTVMWTGLRLLK